MIIDGKQIAESIKKNIREKVAIEEHGPVLSIVSVGNDPVTERYLNIKRKFADDTGVHIEEHRFSETIETDTLLDKIEDLALDVSVQGIVVQLPLPEHIDADAVLGAIPITKDVDVISHEALTLFHAGSLSVLPPVVGACAAILAEKQIPLKDKKVVVVGKGRLVGRPASTWLAGEGALVEVISRSDTDIDEHTRDADIIVLGAGSPGILKPVAVKEGAVVLDAGTSEAEGKLVGDADPACATKCALFTPVPGGIGPVTVAMLFNNLIQLAE
jgi:methylenetetrahydrofolate dehydrogenase (NADP+)/methenyltetrahydrofolate cyclohydrolase